jgi:phage gp37-like protein
MEIFEVTEDAVVGELTPLKMSLGVREVAHYAGQLAAGDLVDIAYRLPAVYVAVSGLSATPRNERNGGEITVGVLVGARGLRGSSEAARGNAGAAGAYDIMQAVYAALQWQPLLGDAQGDLRLARVEPVAQDANAGVWIWSMEFEMDVEI